MLASMSIIGWINTILIIILLIIGGRTLFTYIRGRQVATMLTNEEFKEGMHHAQVVDVREKSRFDASHIMGARSIPFAELRAYVGTLRKDIPVYLYDDGKAISLRVAVQLHKDGFDKVYILKGGFLHWDGKKKKTKL